MNLMEEFQEEYFCVEPIDLRTLTTATKINLESYSFDMASNNKRMIIFCWK